tara:strand:- start:45 stop:248 length:204 start_codon:yes stop_codon:yes gene_type:complete
MKEILDKKFKNIVEVKTTYIITESGHPKVYYKINPNIGYIICNYSNTCFKLSKDADLNTKEPFIYKG